MASSLAIVLAMLIFPILFVALRFLGRCVEHVSWWWDDYAILLSLLFLIASIWADVQLAQYTLSSTGLSSLLWRAYITNIFHTLIVSTTKLSGLLLYFVHFGFKKQYAYPAYAIMGFVYAWTAATFFATVFQCQPISAAWDASRLQSPPSSTHCLDQPTLLLSTSASSAVLDFLILIATFPGAYSMDWIFGRGTLISSSYLLGTFTLVTSILAAYRATQWDPSSMDTFTSYFLWTKLQEGLGIVTVCLWPSAFGMLGLATCSLAEPKERLFAHFRKKTHEKLTREGFGALLSNSTERRDVEMAETACGQATAGERRGVSAKAKDAEKEGQKGAQGRVTGVPMGVKGRVAEMDRAQVLEKAAAEDPKARLKGLRERLDAELEAKRNRQDLRK